MSDTDRVEQWWNSAGSFDQELEMEFRECLSHSTVDPFGRAAICTRDKTKVYTTEEGEAFETDLETLANEIPYNPSASDHTLIVLEDIGRHWIDILGPILGIPVYFFALHWAMPIKHLTGDIRLPAGQSPERHFILPYQQLLPFRITADLAGQWPTISFTFTLSEMGTC